MKFKEKQQFRSYEVFLLIGFFTVGLFIKLIHEIGQVENSSLLSIAGIIIALAGMIWLGWILTTIELKLSVNQKNLKFKFHSPIHNKAKKIPLDNIKYCQIIKTPLAVQWHGGNISFNRHASYTFQGRNGVYIETKDDAAYFIGCKNLDNLQVVLKKVLTKNNFPSE